MNHFEQNNAMIKLKLKLNLCPKNRYCKLTTNSTYLKWSYVQ